MDLTYSGDTISLTAAFDLSTVTQYSYDASGQSDVAVAGGERRDGRFRCG